MKITIIADDNTVGIDGVFEDVTFTGDPNIHAIQWDTVAQVGEVEFKDRNEVITDFSPYQHFIGDHGAAKAARELAEIAATQQVKDDLEALNIANAIAAEAALTQEERRELAYPTTTDQLKALYEARQGNPVPLAAIDSAINSVDVQFPL